jgi:hypothetical protein
VRPSFILVLTAASVFLACESSRSGSKKDATNAAGDGAGASNADATSGGADGSPTGAGTDGTDGQAGGSCLDESYTETLPDPAADLTAEKAAYSSAEPETFVLAALAKRYPIGKYLVEGGLTDKSRDCISDYLGNKSTASAVLPQLSTVVHECGHIFDVSLGGFSGSTFVIRDDLRFECKGLAYSGPKAGFARSLLNGDAYSALRPPCGGGFDATCDSYADIYLDGNPKDAAFDSGDQGFDTVIEEAVQYVNSLACGYAFSDHYDYMTSERDGILTFLWYIERYLHMARLEHPDVYQYIVSDVCWRDAILTVFGRARLYLDATQGDQSLGLNDAAIEKLVQIPELADEIDRIRSASGCQ